MGQSEALGILPGGFFSKLLERSDPVTDAQRRALEAIRDGKVTHHRALRGHKTYWRLPQGVRKDVVERVIGMKLARLGPHHRLLVAYCELTDAGKAALSA